MAKIEVHLDLDRENGDYVKIGFTINDINDFPISLDQENMFEFKTKDGEVRTGFFKVRSVRYNYNKFRMVSEIWVAGTINNP